MSRGITASQTVGPFFAYALTPEPDGFTPLVGNLLRTPDAEGSAIRIEGRVFDGVGDPVPDAMIEIWQADGAGVYARDFPSGSNHKFRGFGRCETKLGVFAFETVMPGSTGGPDGSIQAPHVNVGLFARGLLKPLFTRVYFEDEPLNVKDAILNLVPEERRNTLIAKQVSPGAYAFDIYMQGPNETVFFEA